MGSSVDLLINSVPSKRNCRLEVVIELAKGGHLALLSEIRLKLGPMSQ